MKAIFNKSKTAVFGLMISANLASAQSTIFDIVEGSANHTILESALIQQGLNTTLSDSTINYTLFAPTDSAFNAYLSDYGLTANDLLANADLTKILLHHVLGSEVLSGSLANGEVTTLNGKDVTVNIDSGAKIDSANVLSPDLGASNGVVHSIDYVLLPTYDDVTEVVSLSPDHTTLLAALTQANLVGTLQDLSKEYTVFAPTNQAFTDYLGVAGISANDLLNSPDLTNILLHHVLGSEVLSGSLANGEVTTLNGKDVTVNVDSGAKIDSANVVTPDLTTGNGSVHVIDYVLLPTYDDVTEVVSLSPDHTTLLAALTQANLVGTLQDLSKEYTVFAPTNQAFTDYLGVAGISANDLLNSPDLTNILLHHVLGSEVLSGSLVNGEVSTLNGKDVTINVDSGVKIDSANVVTPDLITGNGAVHVIDYVLLPTYDDVTEVVSLSPDHTTLLAALTQANLVGTLQDLSKEYTVFAPTDQAFTNFLSSAGISANDLLNSPDLTNILLHHVLGSKVLSTSLSDGDVATLNTTKVTVKVGPPVLINASGVETADVVADNGVVHVIDAVLELPNTTNVLKISSADLKIYPNPTEQFITITNLPQNTMIQVFNTQGKIVKSQSYNDYIDVSNLDAGVYFINSPVFSQPTRFVKK